MSLGNSATQHDMFPFQEPLLPLIPTPASDELTRIFMECFDREQLYDKNARRELFEAVEPSQNTDSPLNQDDHIDAAKALVRHMADYRPPHQNPTFHPFLAFHDALIASVSKPIPEADARFLAEVRRRLKAALPALRVGAAVGRLECRQNGSLLRLGSSVLLSGNRLLAPAQLFLSDPRPERVRLGYRYHPRLLNDSFYLQRSARIGAPHEHVTIKQIIGLPVPCLRGLTDDEIAWDEPGYWSAVAIWYYPSDGSPAICALGSLGAPARDENPNAVRHSFGNLGPLALGAPIFDTQWRLVALYQSPREALPMSALDNLRATQRPEDRRRNVRSPMSIWRERRNKQLNAIQEKRRQANCARWRKQWDRLQEQRDLLHKKRDSFRKKLILGTSVNEEFAIKQDLEQIEQEDQHLLGEQRQVEARLQVHCEV